MKAPIYFSIFSALAFVGFSSCAKVKVEPIEVKPIEINVNVRVTVERELDNFFGDLDAKEKKIAN
ncbi:MAG: YnbE family lipoprotein [Akkermansiaceae bacterium]